MARVLCSIYRMRSLVPEDLTDLVEGARFAVDEPESQARHIGLTVSHSAPSISFNWCGNMIDTASTGKTTPAFSMNSPTFGFGIGKNTQATRTR